VANVLMPLPDRDFDVTEVAVPWYVLTRAGHTVTFATERGGSPPAADPLLITGVLFGRLGARPDAKELYARLLEDEGFQAPIAWADINPPMFDGLVLPGGHAPGMRQYLDSSLLRGRIAAFWSLGRPVGAICHGVLVLARIHDGLGRSVLHSRHTTALPKATERTAYWLTGWRHGRYYRTYPAYVQDEVTDALADPSQFDAGPRITGRRGSDVDDRGAFVVVDRNYVSARWPGDAYLFAKRFEQLL
jgi:putative intracellular protease/amidase